MDPITETQVDVGAFDGGQSYIGTEWADWVEDRGRAAMNWLGKASQDQEGIGDDILRAGGKVLQGVGRAAELPGVKQGLQVLDAASYYSGKAGGAIAGAVGVDPRIGGAIGNVLGDVALGGAAAKVGKIGAIKGAHKLAKTDLPGSKLASQGLQRHYMGKAADLNRNRMKIMKQQVGGQSEAMRRGELNLQGLMTNLDSAMWQHKFKKLTDVGEKEKFLTSQYSKDLKDFYVEGGKITPKSLAKDPDTMQKLMDRADKIVEGFARGNQRKLYDQASWNIFDEMKEVYDQGNTLKNKIQAAFLGVQGKQWHHIFGNKEAGEFLLNKVAQDPVIAANLFKHMEKLNLKSGAIAENMALMRAAPHNAWHRFMEDMGFEPRTKMKIGETLKKLEKRNILAQQNRKGEFVPHEMRISKSTGKNQPWKYTAPGDVADFGHEIAQGILSGKTDVNELFSFLTVYHKKYVPWMKQKLKDPKYAAQFLSEVPEGPEKALLLGLYETKLGTRRGPK